MRRSVRSLVALATLAAAALAIPLPGAARDSDLVALPDPPLEGMEPRVRELLAGYRAALDRDAADPGTDRTRLLSGFARVGQLYLLYHLDAAAEACFANARALAPEDARWSYYLGVAHQRQGELERAVPAFERVLAERPDDPASLVRLGRIELALGRLDAAEARFRRVLDASSAPAAALHGLGQVAARRDRWEEAVERFTRALELQPDAAAIHYELGLAHRELGRMDRAREHLAQRGTALPVFPDPLVTGLQALDVGARRHAERGDAHFEQGDLAAAEAAYRQALETDPDDLRAQRSLASVLALQGRVSAAISAYREALRLAPDDARLHHDLGRLLLHAARPEEAAQHLRRSLEVAPDSAEAHADLAVALERSGRLDEAERAAAEVLELRPGDSRAHLALARLRLLRELDPRRDPEAELRRIVAAGPAPPAPMARLTLGALLEARGDVEEALEAYRAVVAAAEAGTAAVPLAARAHLGIARCLAAAGEETESATSHLEAAARLAPDLPEAHTRLAAARAGRSDPEGAARAYRTALGLDPAAAEAHAGLAEALLELGRCVEAREHLARNLSRVPAGSGLRELLERVRASCPEAGREGAPAPEGTSGAPCQGRPEDALTTAGDGFTSSEARLPAPPTRRSRTGSRCSSPAPPGSSPAGTRRPPTPSSGAGGEAGWRRGSRPGRGPRTRSARPPPSRRRR